MVLSALAVLLAGVAVCLLAAGDAALLLVLLAIADCDCLPFTTSDQPLVKRGGWGTSAACNAIADVGNRRGEWSCLAGDATAAAVGVVVGRLSLGGPHHSLCLLPSLPFCLLLLPALMMLLHHWACCLKALLPACLRQALLLPLRLLPLLLPQLANQVS